MAVDRRSRSSGETIGAMLSAGTMRVAGLDVAYYRTGRGPSLLLVHGAAGDAREWRSQGSALSDTFTVIAWMSLELAVLGCAGRLRPGPGTRGRSRRSSKR